MPETLIQARRPILQKLIQVRPPTGAKITSSVRKFVNLIRMIGITFKREIQTVQAVNKLIQVAGSKGAFVGYPTVTIGSKGPRTSKEKPEVTSAPPVHDPAFLHQMRKRGESLKGLP